MSFVFSQAQVDELQGIVNSSVDHKYAAVCTKAPKFVSNKWTPESWVELEDEIRKLLSISRVR